MKSRSLFSPFNRTLALSINLSLITVGLLIVTAGCGGKSSSSSSPTPTPSPTPVPAVTLITGSSNHDTGNVESQVYTFKPDGTTITRVTNIASNESAWGWSPDGGSILISSNRNNNGGIINNTDLYLINPDGTNVRRVTTDTTKNSTTGCFSPDGSNIVFSYGKQIAVVTIADSKITIIDQSSLPSLSDSYCPVYSPDGTKIAFIADTPGDTNSSTSHSQSIFVMKADGTGRTQLTTGGEYIHQIAWSRDGKYFVFDSSLDTGGMASLRTQLYRVNVDGKNRSRLTSNTGLDSSPTFSPDGKLVMYSSNVDNGGGTGGKNPFDLYTIDPNTKEIKRITTSGSSFFLGVQAWK